MDIQSNLHKLNNDRFHRIIIFNSPTTRNNRFFEMYLDGKSTSNRVVFPSYKNRKMSRDEYITKRINLAGG